MSQRPNKPDADELLQNPELPLDEDGRRQLGPARTRQAGEQRLLDEKLRSAFSELGQKSNPGDLSADFDRKLRSAMAGKGASDAGAYVLRLERRQRIGALMDNVLHGDRRYLAYAAAGLLFLGALGPFAWRSFQTPTSEANGAEFAPKAAVAEHPAAAADAQTVAAPPDPSAPMAPGEEAEANRRSFDAVNFQIELLRERLRNVQAASERLPLLEKLEQAYRNAGRTAEAEAAHREIESLRQAFESGAGP
ncbi:MAG: hypothetical protein K1X75_12190 [Leptospirales bacterium]|nr:hypothetical protein [Leptospirales bacterium]